MITMYCKSTQLVCTLVWEKIAFESDSIFKPLDKFYLLCLFLI